ncbi:MAG: hypothetical protein ACI4XQ_02955 [Eubacteriales bacterium]
MPKSRKKSGPVKKTANTAKHHKPITVTEEDKELFEKKYNSKHLIVNLLRIWRDSAPKGFISYFPVMVLYLVYCVLWFLASVLLLFKGTAEFAYNVRNILLNYTPYIGAVLLPVVLTYLHARYNARLLKYYYIKNLLYVIPATLLFIVLCWLNFIIAVMFQSNAGELIKNLFSGCWIVFVLALGMILLCSAIAQAFLMSRRSRDEGFRTSLGVEIKTDRHSKKK